MSARRAARSRALTRRAADPTAALDRMRRVVAAQRDIACCPPEPAAVFQALADAVLRVFPAEGAVAAQPDGDVLLTRASAGAVSPPIGHRLPAEGTLAGLALRTLDGLLCTDSLTDPRTRTDLNLALGTRSSVIVPLAHAGTGIGVIAALSAEPGRFDQEDLALVTMLADVASSRLVAALGELARAESAARTAASEEHFRVAFENAPLGMSMISLAPGETGRYLRANAAFVGMLGWSRDEIARMSMADLTHPADRDRDLAQFQLLAGGEDEAVAFEKRYLHRSGEAVQAWVTSSVVRDTDGRPLYLVTHALDLRDRMREQAELRRLALTDTLTGLANRTLLNDRLVQALARLRRTDGAAALLMLDVDRFKTVNDSLGHQVGDALLVEVAQRIRSVSRADATVARLGGDEFVVLVEGLPRGEAVHAVADRLLGVLRRPYDLGPSGGPLVATVSIGVAVATDATRPPGDLYREADLALYRAKDSGRDRYALFDDQLRARAERRMAAETLLRRALDRDQLVPVFQPIVDLTDGRLHAAEALVRIRDGDRLLPPVDFIDVAEETGLIGELDARMAERAVAELARLRRAGIPLRRISTNASARSLGDPRYVRRLQAALARHDVPGAMVRVELTERSLFSSSPAIDEALDGLRGLGAQVGLDDFGTGYSALAYLQRLDLSFLKIDRSFVSRLGTARGDAVVAAVVDLAHAHDLIVVAEGVETGSQLAALRAMGCDRAQGYLIGRPVPAGELEALLRTAPRW